MNATGSVIDRLIREDAFRLLTEVAIVSVTDRAGRIVFANENFAKISGYPVADLIGKLHNIVNSGHHPKAFWAAMWAQVTRGTPWRGVVKNKTRSGKFYWVDAQIMPLKNQDGEIAGFLSVRNDITTEKDHEQALEQERYKLQAIYNNSADSHVLISPDGIVLSYNPSAFRFVMNWCGKKIETDQPVLSFLPAESFNEFNLNFARALQGEEVKTEQEVTSLDGQRRWYRVAYAPVYDDAGRLMGVARTCGDISKRKMAEKILRAERQQLVSLVEALPDAIFMKDGHNRWLITNEPAKRLFNLHGVEWYGKTDDELAELQPQYREAYRVCREDDEKAWRAGQLTLFTEFVSDGTGRLREYAVRKLPVFNADGSRRALVISGTDVTTQRLMEEHLKTRNDKLEHIAWLFSHRVRGPVATILGLAQLFNHNNISDPINAQVIERMPEPTRQLDAIISEIVNETYALDIHLHG